VRAERELRPSRTRHSGQPRLGWLPFTSQQGGGGALRSQGDLDERAKRLAAYIARRIAEDPAIIDRVIEWINQHEREEPDPSKRELEEWRSVLTTLSSRQVEALLMEESERADRPRQSLPFVDVLTSEDRAAMFRERRDAQRARARHPRRV
jgi:hypothetical protein